MDADTAFRSIRSAWYIVVLGVAGAVCAALVLGEALAGHADMFVTGDAALLRLAAVGVLRIVLPRQFWELLRSGDA